MTTPQDLLFIGTTGCFYNHWTGAFYPEVASPLLGTQTSKEPVSSNEKASAQVGIARVPTGANLLEMLRFYSQHFRTVQITQSAYHLLQQNTLREWMAATDERFVFSMVASRAITHCRKLRDVQEPLQSFFSRLSPLGDRVAPTLFQLPHSLQKDIVLLRDFLALLPKEHECVVEFRHTSWFDDTVLACLAEHQTGFGIVSAPRLPIRIETTAPFASIRFHGTSRWFVESYSDDDLEWWALEIRNLLEQGKRVYAYFANDEAAAAVWNAKRLEQLVGQ